MGLICDKLRPALSPFLKRSFDLLFSLLFIFIFSPVYLLITLLIKLTSRGCVFYVGERLGRGGKVIKIFKFRTMHVNAEESLQDVLEKNPDIRREWEVFRKIQHDPRCTWVGKFLRKTSFDEFPQFFNVLKGDLSVVGPRPYFVSELCQGRGSPLKEHAHLILKVRPGMTGLWQTSGRSRLSYEERVKLDRLYVIQHSFLYDMCIILKTIPSILFAKGAF